MSEVSAAVQAALNEPLKLDIGCGKNKQPGYIGIDQFLFEGVDIVADLRHAKWLASTVPDALKPRLLEVSTGSESQPFYGFHANSVDHIHCSHFLEHLTNLNDRWERVNFFNEAFRILKPGATMTLIFPHWASVRYYGDPTHKEPFSEMGFYYLKRDWRMQGNAPHADSSVNPHGYSCDFDATWALTYDTNRFVGRSPEYVQYALQNYKDAALDIHATLTKPAQSR